MIPHLFGGMDEVQLNIYICLSISFFCVCARLSIAVWTLIDIMSSNTNNEFCSALGPDIFAGNNAVAYTT